MILHAIAKKGRVGRIIVIFVAVLRLRNGGIGGDGRVFGRLAVAVIVIAMFLVNVANGLGLGHLAWCSPPRNDSLRDHFISTFIIVIIKE